MVVQTDDNTFDDDDELPEIVKVAMKVIMAAGEARTAAEDSLKKLHTFDFEAAQSLSDESFLYLKKAHNAQTEVIQSEAAGTKYENSFLFNHAQDSVMTAMTQCNLTKEIILLYKILYEKIISLK